MTYYEYQLAKLGEVDQYGVTMQFQNSNGKTNHFTLSADEFEKVKELLLNIKKEQK